ncbi:hypothetical protein PN465_00470 [Nodularia spumigena CS-584]|jgi:hypothetical protein|uniref:hypothetical protein n=1 Tax=Nodularia spumigena TaxID=70799 RepID=UPI0000EA94E8|nr:hypothetical protein [Nodularia spumigena]AHJ31300.1 hypothetical protein NSP_50110 [Nodularia spumigena CCY9414]EAW44779.1 hypothetical protein N9414_08684 [Nodularia spumigena CCY9414]MDB9380720.1 hypothetical protein [Nodularia spumigena CS-584]
MQKEYLEQLNRRKGILIRKKLIYVIIATIAYAIFMVFFAWDKISISAVLEGGFRDFGRYVLYFNNAVVTGTSKAELYNWQSWNEYFTGEVLWDELVIKLTEITGEATIALRIVSFFICLVWGAYLFPKVSIPWALVFLLNPTSIDVILSGIRNGFAWSIFILATILKPQGVKYILFALTPFIHSSSAILLLLNFCQTNFFSLRIPKLRLIPTRIRIILWATLPGVFAGIILTVGNSLLQFLGDRRLSQGEDYIRGGGSFLQMLFWILLILVQLNCNNDYIKKHSLVINILAWYIVMNPFIPWSYRIWGATMPLIAYAIWELPRKQRKIIFYIWIAYLIIWYLYWSILFNYWYPS